MIPEIPLLRSKGFLLQGLVDAAVGDILMAKGIKTGAIRKSGSRILYQQTYLLACVGERRQQINQPDDEYK
jgi:hypothetical protein